MRMVSLTIVFASTACAGEIPDTFQPDGAVDPLVQPTTPLVESVMAGSFQPLGAFTGIEGRALMVRQLDGKTDLSISLSGATPNAMYIAHVHVAPCQFQVVVPPAVATFTGHYMIDPALALTSTEANELWIRAQASATGVMAGSALFTHLPRGEALSVVVHDPVLGKMACADLLADEVATTVEMTGTLAPFALAGATDQTISGTITASRTNAATSFTLSLTGLDPAALEYGAHIHNQPCAVQTGAGHYMIDPTVAAASIDGTNEIWFPITVGTATATVPVTVPFGARTDAQSIVLHRTNLAATKLKVACANLTRTTVRAPLETTATALALPAAAGMSLSGTALMTRKLSGVTEVAVVMTGLLPDTTYDAHVHNQPCSAEAGGGHYKFDKAASGADNELAFELVANAEGTASDSTWSPKLAQADAESIIVHAADGARLACFDLQ